MYPICKLYHRVSVAFINCNVKTFSHTTLDIAE